MEKAAYFILIFCGFLSQGICNVYQESNGNSSDLLIRQKRVAGGAISPLENSPFLLAVLESGNYHCPVTLLTADVAISSASCFINQNPQNMRITSRSRAGGSQLHEIVRVIYLDPNYHSGDPTVKNLVLIKFAQPINFQSSFNRPIVIYNEYLPTDYSPTHVYAWGKPRTVGRRKLPSSSARWLPLLMISFEYCQSVYENIVHFGNICAVGSIAREHCENEDTGTPLVANNQLLGIFVYHSPTRTSNPNVFMNLLDHGIRRWIHQHVPSLRLF